MGSMQLQPRPLYGIGTVSRLTGVKPDTLRIWERRYQLGSSYKSASGRRQYTQADLEHLQMISTLVSSGTRIGEIAGLGRLTLEALLQARCPEADSERLLTKPNVVFVGVALCHWLEEHQGCLANMHAQLAPVALDGFDAAVGQLPDRVDNLVVECEALSPATHDKLLALAARLDSPRILVFHREEEAAIARRTADWNLEARAFPPEPAFISLYVARCEAEKEAKAGNNNMGDLVAVKSRIFDDQALEAIAGLQARFTDDCPQQLPELVRALAGLEEWSADGSVESWEDASLRACVYLYAGQARWLMERALNLVIDAERDRAKQAAAA